MGPKPAEREALQKLNAERAARGLRPVKRRKATPQTAPTTGSPSASTVRAGRSHPGPMPTTAPVGRPVVIFPQWCELLLLGDIFNEYHLDIPRKESLKDVMPWPDNIRYEIFHGQWLDGLRASGSTPASSADA